MGVSGLKPLEQWTHEDYVCAGRRLARARVFAGLSRTQAARLIRADMEPPRLFHSWNLEDLEAGRHALAHASIPLFLRLCSLYGIDPEALLDADPVARVRETEVGRSILAAGGVSEEDKARLLEFASFLRQKGPAPDPALFEG